MGKYIKYFNTTAEFSEFWNFADWAPGPGDDDDSTFVAFVSESGAVYYNTSDLSEFQADCYLDSSEIDATADTVTLNVATKMFWLELYHNGELVDTYTPDSTDSVSVYVGANTSPLTVDEQFAARWYEDDGGEKGDFITQWDSTAYHQPDPTADPVKLQCFVSFDSDGQSPTRLGNGSLTGATRVYYDDNGSEVDILNDIYIQSKRAWYQFSAQGEYNVCFEFESENQVVGDYFIYSQGKSLGIYTNYPELAEQTNFRFNGPLMQASIEELIIGEGMLSVNGFLNANSLNHITLDDQNKLPELNGSLRGVAAEGTVEAVSRDVENFSMWENNLPSGWTMLPEPGPTPVEGTVGKLTLKFDIDSINDNPIVGGDLVTDELSGTMEAYDPNGQQLSSDDFQVYLDKQNNTRFYVPNYTDGEYTLVLRRESTDLLLQGWCAGGEFKSAKYEEEAFEVGSTHISLYERAFSGCTNLETVELGENCVGVSLTAFDGCTNLTEIICHPSTEIPLTDLTEIQFTTIAQNTGTLEIPSGSSYVNWEAALNFSWTVVDDL